MRHYFFDFDAASRNHRNVENPRDYSNMASVFGNTQRIEPLTKQNYDTWCIQVEALLVIKGTWCYVNGEIPISTSAAAGQNLKATQDAWKAEDRKAKSDLILSISPDQLRHIKNCVTSKEVWEKLKSLYASQGPMRKATLLEKLLLMKMHEGNDMQDHLSSFMDTVDKLHTMEIEINGDLLSIMLLHSLPASFDNFSCAIMSRDKLPSVETLMVKIIEEHDSKIHRSGESGSDVMFSRQKSARGKQQRQRQHRQQQNSNNGKRESNGDEPKKPKCTYCKKKGHKIEDCFKKLKDEQSASTATICFTRVKFRLTSRACVVRIRISDDASTVGARRTFAKIRVYS